MNLRSLLFRAAFAAALLGFAYAVSIGARQWDAAFPADSSGAQTAALLPLVGLPLIRLLSLP